MPRFKRSSIISTHARDKDNFQVFRDTLRTRLTAGILILAMMSVQTSAYAVETQAYFYRVREKDSLTAILYRLGIKPIYGKKGHLELSLVLNPKIKSSRGDKLYPGDVVYLPVTDEKRLKEIAEVLATGEVILDSERGLAVVHAVPGVNECTGYRAPAEVQGDVAAADVSGPEVTHSLEVSLNYDFTALQATDLASGAGAYLYTSSAPGVAMKFIQGWSEGFKSYFKFDLGKLTFAPSANAVKTLGTESVTRTRLTLGFDQAISKRFALQAFAAYGSELFIRGLNTQSISIDAKPLPSIGIKPELSLYTLGHTSVGVFASGQYVFGGEAESYQIKSGYRLGLGTYLILRRNSGQNYKLVLGYETRPQNTSATSQSENEVYGGLNFEFLPFAPESGQKDKK